MSEPNGLQRKCAEIANAIVPEYETGNYSCTGMYAKRWNAAYEAAELILTRLSNNVLAMAKGAEEGSQYSLACYDIMRAIRWLNPDK